MNPKNILFLAGGRWQVPWIKFLNQKKHNIILVDPHQNPACSKWADNHLQIDVKKLDKIKHQVEKNNFKIDLVTSEQTDVSTLPVAHLSEYFGIATNSVKSVERFALKDKSRDFINNYFGHKHIPEYKIIQDENDLISFYNTVKKDIIVKPVDSQSSRGLFKISD